MLCKSEELRRAWNRSKRIVTGASTEMRMKNGRRISTSRMTSSWMSVVTHRCCQRFVTKSTRLWTSGNVCDWPVEPPLTDAVASEDLLCRYSGWNPWWSIRYSATVCLPAQIPPQMPTNMTKTIKCRVENEDVIDHKLEAELYEVHNRYWKLICHY